MVVFYLGFVVLLVLMYWTLSIEGSPRNVPVRTPFGSDTVALSWFMTGIIYWLSLLLIFYGILLDDKEIVHERLCIGASRSTCSLWSCTHAWDEPQWGHTRSWRRVQSITIRLLSSETPVTSTSWIPKSNLVIWLSTCFPPLLCCGDLILGYWENKCYLFAQKYPLRRLLPNGYNRAFFCTAKISPTIF